MGDDRGRGHTGQKVREAGTYKSGAGEVWTYVPGDMFRSDPETGLPTVWEKTREPDHPGGTR